MTIPLVIVSSAGTDDASLQGLSGSVCFRPVAVPVGGTLPLPTVVTGTADGLVIEPAGVTRNISGGAFSVGLVPTDRAGLSPAGWGYSVTLVLAGVQPVQSFTTLIPYGTGAVDFSALIPAVLVAQLVSPVLSVNGQTGNVVISGGGSGSDANFTQAFTTASTVTVTHNLGKLPSVTVIDTAEDICFGDVQYLSTNALRVTFSAATSGTVICN